MNNDMGDKAMCITICLNECTPEFNFRTRLPEHLANVMIYAARLRLVDVSLNADERDSYTLLINFSGRESEQLKLDRGDFVRQHHNGEYIYRFSKTQFVNTKAAMPVSISAVADKKAKFNMEVTVELVK